MDYKKDISPSFISQYSKNILIFKLFEKDSHLLFLYKKSERVASALYLLSNLFSDSEPIKWQFRDAATGIISSNLSLLSDSLSRPEILFKLSLDFVRLLSLLDIAYVAGLVSEMNFTILKKELEHLLETLNLKGLPHNVPSNKKALFDKDFFALPEEELGPEISAANPSSAGHSFPSPQYGKRHSVHTWSDAARISPGILKGQDKGHESYKPKSYGTIKNYKQGDSSDITNGPDRQSVILEILKSKNNLTIKDFALAIKNCSSKTIQRELSKLVKLGILKKEGERRWSRYSLAM